MKAREMKILVVPLAAMVLVAGCASTMSSVPPEEAVRARAEQRWQALVQDDFAKVYAFTAPSYRKIHSLEHFRDKKQGAPMKWVGARILQIDCDAAKCVIEAEWESKLAIPFRFNGTLKSALRETWVLEDGKWWMFENL